MPNKTEDLTSLCKPIFNPREGKLKAFRESSPPLVNLKSHSQQKNTMKKRNLTNSNNLQLLLTNNSIPRLDIMPVVSSKTTDKKRKRTHRSATSVAHTMRISPLTLLIFIIGRTAPCSPLVGSVSKSLKSHRWLTI
jgi:hypothetical protein